MEDLPTWSIIPKRDDASYPPKTNLRISRNVLDRDNDGLIDYRYFTVQNTPYKFSLEYQVLGRDVSSEDLERWEDKTQSYVKEFVYQDLPYVQYSNAILPPVNEPGSLSASFLSGIEHQMARGMSFTKVQSDPTVYEIYRPELQENLRDSVSLSVSIQGTCLIPVLTCLDMDGNPILALDEADSWPFYYVPAPFGTSMDGDNIDITNLLFAYPDDCNGGFMNNSDIRYKLYVTNGDNSKYGQVQMQGHEGFPSYFTMEAVLSVPPPLGKYTDSFTLNWSMPEQMKVIYDYTDSEYYKTVNSSPEEVREQYYISGDDEYDLDGFEFQYFLEDDIEISQQDESDAVNSIFAPIHFATVRCLQIDEKWQDWFVLRQEDDISSDYMANLDPLVEPEEGEFTPTLLSNSFGEYYLPNQSLHMLVSTPPEAFKAAEETVVIIDGREFTYSNTKKCWFRVRSIFKCIKPMENAIGKIMPDGVIYTANDNDNQTSAIILEASSDWKTSEPISKLLPRDPEEAGIAGYGKMTVGSYPSGDLPIDFMQPNGIIDDTKTMEEILNPTTPPLE